MADGQLEERNMPTITKDVRQFVIAVATIERGSTHAAFFNSSERCTVESAPLRYGTGPFRPTRQANPIEDQPLLSNSVNTDEGVPRGAVTLHDVRPQA